MKTTIEQYETQERKQFIKNNKFKSYKLSPINSKSTIDGYGVSGNTLIFFEIKCRKCEHDTYDEQMIELHKYQSLKKWALKNKTIAIYINYFLDGYEKIYQLNFDKEPKKVKINRTKYTFKDGGTREDYVYLLGRNELIELNNNE